MALPVYLQQFKAAGIYRVVFDKSTILNQDTSILRLLVGYSDKGPFNVPVYVRSVSDFKALFGEASKTMEKRGNFFHRTAMQMLGAGPILCLNLKKFSDEVVVGNQIDTTFNTSYAINTVEIPVEDIYDTTRFWTLSADKLNDVRGAEYINISATNTKALSGTYFIRKASGNKVAAYNITVADYYRDAHEDVPEFLLGKEQQKMSDFFAEIYVFKGRFTADQVLASDNLKKYFEVSADGKLVLKQYVLNGFGDTVDTLDELYHDETSGAIEHYVGSLIPYFRDKNGSYASLDIIFNQDVDAHNMMMSFNTDMLDEDGTANIDLSGKSTISTHDNGNQHDQGHKLASANVMYGAKPVCLDDIFDGVAVTNLLGNSNSPVVSDDISFSTNLYNEDGVVKHALNYAGAKKVTGTMYVSAVAGSNITLTQVGDITGASNITIDAAGADDVMSILYQLGAAYVHKYTEDGVEKSKLVMYPSGLGTYFNGNGAYSSANDIQGPKKVITSVSRDVNVSDDATILLGGNTIKCTIEDVYIVTKSQYHNTLIGDSVKIVSDEEYNQMVKDAGYENPEALDDAQYLSITEYEALVAENPEEAAKYRPYNDITKYQKYDYTTPVVFVNEEGEIIPEDTVSVDDAGNFVDTEGNVLARCAKFNIADPEKGTSYTLVEINDGLVVDPRYGKSLITVNLNIVEYKSVIDETQRITVDEYNALPKDEKANYKAVYEISGYKDADGNEISISEYEELSDDEKLNYTPVTDADKKTDIIDVLIWHEVVDGKETITREQVNTPAGKQDIVAECPEHLYFHAVVRVDKYSDASLNPFEYKVAVEEVDPNTVITYETLPIKTGWKPVYETVAYFLITDAELLAYDPYKYVQNILLDTYNTLSENHKKLFRPGYEIAAYQKFDYTLKWNAAGTAVVPAFDPTQEWAVTDNTFTDGAGTEWHLIVDDKCKTGEFPTIVYAHSLISVDSYETLMSTVGVDPIYKASWKPVYKVAYYYRIVSAARYAEMTDFDKYFIGADDAIGQVDSEGKFIPNSNQEDDGKFKVYSWINGNLKTNESWNIYGSAVTFVKYNEGANLCWDLESDQAIDADTELHTYTMKASGTDDMSILAFAQKGDCFLAEDATSDSDGDGEYDDEVINGLYDLCYVQETGTTYDEDGVAKEYWVKFTGKPAIFERDGFTYLVRINSALNQEIGSMQPMYLKGYTYANPKPNGTSMIAKLNWLNYQLSALTDYKGLRTGLLNPAEVDFRYIVDGFESFVEAGCKKVLSALAKEKELCLAILNFPSVHTFVKCPYTSFVDNKGVFNVQYVVDGYNKKKAATTRFSLPSNDEGASFAAFYTPLKVSDGYIDTAIPSAGVVSNLFVEKYASRQPYYIVAGPNYGAISVAGLVGPDYNYSTTKDGELQIIEPFGVNCMVYKPGFGTYINANQTAKQTPKSALSSINVRELVIYLQDEIGKILQSYQWEFNNQTVRNKIKDRADFICNQVKANGGLVDFVNVMDESNNTPEIIDNEFAILSTHIEPGRGMGKMVHELTIYANGTMRSSIAGE